MYGNNTIILYNYTTYTALYTKIACCTQTFNEPWIGQTSDSWNIFTKCTVMLYTLYTRILSCAQNTVHPVKELNPFLVLENIKQHFTYVSILSGCKYKKYKLILVITLDFNFVQFPPKKLEFHSHLDVIIYILGMINQQSKTKSG